MLYFLKGGDEVPIEDKGSEAVGNHGFGTNWLLHCLASHISSLTLSFCTGKMEMIIATSVLLGILSESRAL